MAKVWPVKKAEDCATMQQIANKIGGWVALFHDISMGTGWRTGDVCALRFDDIDFDTGFVTISVAKQTKAAKTKAFMNVVRQAIENRRALADDNAEFRRLTLIKPVDFIPELTAEELKAAEKARANAKGKESVVALRPDIVERIKALQERDSANQWVFAKQFTESRNSGSLADGHISRQSVWKRFRQIGAKLKEAGVKIPRFSAYSLRKAFAYAIKRVADAAGRNGTAEACDALGHSSIAMTRKYLMLDIDEMIERQRRLWAAQGYAEYAAAA